MHPITVFIAQYFIAVSLLLTLWFFTHLPRSKQKEFVLIGIIGGLIALALAFIGGHLFYNPRPFIVGHFTPWFPHGNDNGFPSDHALLASFMAFLVLKFSKKYGVILCILAVLIGSARVIAGVHHSIDIIGSFAFSAIGISIAAIVAKKYQRSFNKLLKATFHV